MSYGSAQTRSSRGGALAMRVTVAAATNAAASLARVGCIVLPADPAEGEGGVRDTTPGAGARSLRHRVTAVLPATIAVLPHPASGQREHEQCAARVADVDVVTKGADRA